MSLYLQFSAQFLMQDFKAKMERSPQPKNPFYHPNNILSTQEPHEDTDTSGLFLANSFQSTTKYSLNHLNSIFFQNGKIYNLLARNAERKVVRCGCVKSFCQAKYCECFRSGQACGKDCVCRSCKNTVQNAKNRFPDKIMQQSNAPLSSNNLQNPLGQSSAGCRCRKSGCSKKYCQCFQNNKKCGPSCACLNCENGRPESEEGSVKKQQEFCVKEEKEQLEQDFQQSSSRRRSRKEPPRTKNIKKEKKSKQNILDTRSHQKKDKQFDMEEEFVGFNLGDSAIISEEKQMNRIFNPEQDIEQKQNENESNINKRTNNKFQGRRME